MGFKLNKNDIRLLHALAEYRILTVSQVTAIQQRGRQVIRRRLKRLREAGFVDSTSQGFGRGMGRPERLISLAHGGIKLLRSHRESLKNVPDTSINAERLPFLDHQLLTNWFRIHLGHMEHSISQLSVRFLAPTSPFLKRDHKDRPLIFERIPGEGNSGEPVGFTPDGVFSTKHRETQKTLLFFLEVDMGTETIASPKRDPRDIRQKILNYQKYFRSGRYKRYEKVWDCELNGFRLLFLTNTDSRLLALCRLVREMPPSDFVWITSLNKMFSDGLSAEIWFRGGGQENPLESILGREMACRVPVLPLKA